MSGQAARVRNADAAEHDVVAIAEGVDVEAGAGAHIAKRRHAQRFGPGEIVVGRELHVAGLASEYAYAMAGPFGERGVVGEIVAAGGRGAAVRVHDERRRQRLAGSAPCASGCDRAFRSPCPAASTFFTVSVMATAGTAAPCSFAAVMARAIRAPLKNGRAASWIRTISGAVDRQRLEPGAHGSLPRGAARNRRQHVAQAGRRGAERSRHRPDE